MEKINRKWEPIERRWSGLGIVAASGPSLTPEVAQLCRGQCIAVNDAYKLVPWADALYAGDWRWWKHHQGCPGFNGTKFIPSVRVKPPSEACHVVKQYGLRVVEALSNEKFSLDPARIHCGIIGTGANSGLQALNLAILFGANPIVLVGFDMRQVDGKRHFFGSHPKGLMQVQNFSGWVANITKAAAHLPSDITIINATPGSALKCFPIMSPQEALTTEATDGIEARHAA